MSLCRFGDRYHEAFTAAISCRFPGDSMVDAQAALAALEACGHELLSMEELTRLRDQPRGPSMVFSRLELLAWRGVDDEQDRFAQARTMGDQRGMAEAASSAGMFLALISLLSPFPTGDGATQ